MFLTLHCLDLLPYFTIFLNFNYLFELENFGYINLNNILTTECDAEVNLPASLYAVSEDESIDKSFFYGILTEGFVITPAISNYLVKVVHPSPKVLFTYSMDALSPQEKVKGKSNSLWLFPKEKKIKNILMKACYRIYRVNEYVQVF